MKRLSEGVTKDNNAAVLLVEALGPEIIEADTREKALKRLGVNDLSKTGRHIVSQVEMIKRWQAGQPAEKKDTEDSLEQQFTDAQIRPWRDEEFPIVAEWIALNEKPLEIAVRATQRQSITFHI